MRTVFATVCVTLVVALVTSSKAGEPKGKDQRNPSRYEVRAQDMADEFYRNPKKAAQKYSPEPPKKGIFGGAIVQVTGEITAGTKNEITFKTDGKVKVVLLVYPALTKDPGEGRRTVTAKEGKFKEFKTNTIYIEASGENVEVKQIDGK